jgi:predicted TIM-barrel fold metal-dependent hydrolase
MQKIIDAHHHIWRMADLPWLLQGKPRIFGDYSSLKRDYPIEEFKTDTAPCNVVKSVYVQANWEHHRGLEEARWVHETGLEHGMPNGIVAFADLNAPDVERLLDDYLKIPSVRGIRQHLQWHKNPLLSGYVPVPDMFNQKQWRNGLRAVGDRGYSFDLQVFPNQIVDAAGMVGEFPDINFILNHAGMLDARDNATIAVWKSGMRILAEHPNVYVKFTGLGTFVHASSVELNRPLVQVSLEYFGASRCIYGSNFPIEKLWTTYAGYFKNVYDAVGDVPEADLHEIFYGTAERVYRLA